MNFATHHNGRATANGKVPFSFLGRSTLKLDMDSSGMPS